MYVGCVYYNKAVRDMLYMLYIDFNPPNGSDLYTVSMTVQTRKRSLLVVVSNKWYA